MIPRIAGSADGVPVVIHPPPLSRPDGLPAEIADKLVLAPSLRSEHVEPEEPGAAYSLISESVTSPRRIDASRRSRTK